VQGPERIETHSVAGELVLLRRGKLVCCRRVNERGADLTECVGVCSPYLHDSVAGGMCCTQPTQTVDEGITCHQKCSCMFLHAAAPAASWLFGLGASGGCA
jgi:hypothetical protein